jgi:putative oxidoreductase
MNTQANAQAQYGITLLRVVVGLIFVMHGGQKVFVMGIDGVAGFFGSIGIPFAYVSAVLVTVVELLGGALLMAGLFTRFVTPLLAITMVGAIATVHGSKGFFLPEGYEFALTLLVSSAALFLTGSGALALDSVFGRPPAAPVRSGRAAPAAKSRETELATR